MGTPSPELKQLWIRVLKRVHPDLAIDEQDRIRCERLTKLANVAYRAGDMEALKAVLRPPTPWYFPLGTAFSVKQLLPVSMKQLLPVSIALVILIWGGFSLYSLRTSQHAVTNSPTAQVYTINPPIKAHVEAEHLLPSKSYAEVIQPVPQKTSAPVANSAEPSPLYMEQMAERLHQSFTNYERVDANVPPGNASETWFDVNRDGSLSNVRIGKPSGWNSLDYACVRAVQRAGTVGALPEEYKPRTLPATFACTYNGSNVLQPSTPVDSAADRSDLYVGSVRNTTP
jgi:TonB family protein